MTAGTMFWRRQHTATRGAIADRLRDIGIAPGGTLVLHSSLSSLGRVEGGAGAVVEACLDALGPEGTLLVPTFTHCFAPRGGRKRAKQGPFDRDRTPSSVGKITEAVRLRDGACRSLHPIHSAAAAGPAAAELTADHARHSDFGAETPFGRALRRDATILLLGVGQNVNSTLHAVEDMLDMPYLVEERALLDSGHGRVEAFTCTKCPTGCRDFYRGDDTKWNHAIQKTGIVDHATIGCAKVQVMRAADLMQTAVNLLLREPELLLCDSLTCVFCGWARRQVRLNGIEEPRCEV